jgi:putative proteasome-type protease
MTYCVGMLLHSGLVMVSDSRTHAGVDNISTFRKMTVWERPGERVVVLLSAGNLAISQAVIALLNEGVPGAEGEEPGTMLGVPSMTEAARLVGRALREVERIDGPSLEAHGAKFEASLILGGQIAGRQLRLFLVYGAGNFIEATPETPYFQIGENKYGKPIIDRVVSFDTSLNRAAKCALISVDSSMRSNVSVGPPIDVLLYERDAPGIKVQRLIEEGDPYFEEIRHRWSQGSSAVTSVGD